MPQISRLVRIAVYNRLVHSTLGFNFAVGTAASGYLGVDTDLLVIPDWTPGGANFLFGRVPPDFVEQSSVSRYPFCTVDTMRTVTGSGAGRWTMSSTFAGTIDVVVDLHLSWPESSVNEDFASYGDLAEDAMFASLNNPSSVISAAGLACSGRLSLARGPITMGGQNWRQTLTFNAPFAVNV